MRNYRCCLFARLVNLIAAIFYFVAIALLNATNPGEGVFEKRLSILLLPGLLFVISFWNSKISLCIQKALGVMFFLVVAFATTTLFPPHPGYGIWMMIGTSLITCALVCIQNFMPVDCGG